MPMIMRMGPRMFYPHLISLPIVGCISTTITSSARVEKTFNIICSMDESKCVCVAEFHVFTLMVGQEASSTMVKGLAKGATWDVVFPWSRLVKKHSQIDQNNKKVFIG